MARTNLRMLIALATIAAVQNVGTVGASENLNAKHWAKRSYSSRPERFYVRDNNKYRPHQGKQECARRRAQIAKLSLTA